MYKDNASWIAVAKYMYGDQWKEILLPAPQQDEEEPKLPQRDQVLDRGLSVSFLHHHLVQF